FHAVCTARFTKRGLGSTAGISAIKRANACSARLSSPFCSAFSQSGSFGIAIYLYEILPIRVSSCRLALCAPTFTNQNGCQFFARPEQVSFYSSFRQAQHFGNLFYAELFPVTQNDDFPVFRPHLCKGGVQGPA